MRISLNKKTALAALELKSNASKKKAEVFLSLIDTKLKQGRTNLFLSYLANKDYYDEHGLGRKFVGRLIATAKSNELIKSVKRPIMGVSFEEFQVNYDFVIFPKPSKDFKRSIDVYYYMLNKYGSEEGFALFIGMKSEIRSWGVKRVTCKRLREFVLDRNL